MLMTTMMIILPCPFYQKIQVSRKQWLQSMSLEEWAEDDWFAYSDLERVRRHFVRLGAPLTLAALGGACRRLHLPLITTYPCQDLTTANQKQWAVREDCVQSTFPAHRAASSHRQLGSSHFQVGVKLCFLPLTQESPTCKTLDFRFATQVKNQIPSDSKSCPLIHFPTWTLPCSFRPPTWMRKQPQQHAHFRMGR